MPKDSWWQWFSELWWDASFIKLGLWLFKGEEPGGMHEYTAVPINKAFESALERMFPLDELTDKEDQAISLFLSQRTVGEWFLQLPQIIEDMKQSSVNIMAGMHEKSQRSSRALFRPAVWNQDAIFRWMLRRNIGLKGIKADYPHIQKHIEYTGLAEDVINDSFDQFVEWPDLNSVLSYSYNRLDAITLSPEIPENYKDNEFFPETDWNSYLDRLFVATGIPLNFKDIFYGANERPIDPATAKAIYHRMKDDIYLPPGFSSGHRDSDPFGNRSLWSRWYEMVLRRNRIPQRDIQAIREMDELIPPVTDLISMAVREVFSPAQVQQLGLFEEFPDEFGFWAEKQGLSQDWALKYWGQHWDLPSPQMAFEMFQRKVISFSELEGLLKALDISPTWRDKLTQIAYKVLSRVDVRRMHKVGVLTPDEVYDSYLDQGFSPTNAKRMTDFTIAFNIREEKDLTKGEVLKMFKAGTISWGEAVGGLRALDFSLDAIEQLLDFTLYEEETKRKELSQGTIRKLFLYETIGKTEAISRLGILNFRQAEIDKLLEIWQLEKKVQDAGPDKEPKNLTKAELKKFLLMGIIGPDEWFKEMSRLGYRNKHIEWFGQAIMLGLEANA